MIPSRQVFLDEDGRQFVLDDNGDRDYGVWIFLYELLIVSTASYCRCAELKNSTIIQFGER